MGWRFRRSIRILPGVRLNIGKKGINSASFGGKGFTTTVGKKSTYQNVGIPGTGLSYRTRVDNVNKSDTSQNGNTNNSKIVEDIENGRQTIPINNSFADKSDGSFGFFVAIGAIFILGLFVVLAIIWLLLSK